MNWYIYWYFTIKYFFWGLLGYGRAGNYIGFVFFYLPFVALIMALIAPFPFVNDNKLLIYLSCSILFIVINEIVFWDETKRYRGTTITGTMATIGKVGFLLLFL